MKLPEFINILKSFPEGTQIDPAIITENSEYEYAELMIAGFTGHWNSYTQLPLKDFPIKMSIKILHDKNQYANVLHQFWLARDIRRKDELHLFFEKPKWNRDFLIWEGKNILLPNKLFPGIGPMYSYKVEISIK
jgi:hypothetical protein